MYRWPRLFGVFAGLLLFLSTSSAVLADDAVHIVQPGETLSQIAETYDTEVSTLRRLNNLSNINFVWSGQRLVLPADVNTQTNPAESRVEAEIPEETYAMYTVEAGDTLLSVASRHGTNLVRLVELNSIYPGQRLVVGQELRVPQRTHLVQSGEHLGTIAARYDTTPNAIARANQLADPSLLIPGQQLIIAPPSLYERVAAETVEGTEGYHTHNEFPTTTEKWIDVDLSEQRVVAYEGTKPVKAFIVATGLPGTPTVTGSFRIWAKTPVQAMYGGNRAAGTYYYLPNVQWVQYFYEDYAFHGTYWHTNWGRPASRGCINMTNADAKWLFDWASPTHTEGGWYISEGDEGTLVIVHI